MEGNRSGSQPEINSDYIDKLLSMPREVQEKSVRKAAEFYWMRDIMTALPEG